MRAVRDLGYHFELAMVEFFHGMSPPSQLLNPFNLYGILFLRSTPLETPQFGLFAHLTLPAKEASMDGVGPWTKRLDLNLCIANF